MIDAYFLEKFLKNLNDQSDSPDYTAHIVLAGLARALEKTLYEFREDHERGLPF